MRVKFLILNFGVHTHAQTLVRKLLWGSMFQEYWAEQEATNTRQGGRIAPHVHSLLTLLHSHLSHHQFHQATPILETLALATDRAPGVVWRGGREVLLHSGDYTHALQLYRSFFKVQQWRVEALLEMSFYIASHGHLDEAYDTLSSQLQVNPFKSHPLCHGYCGLYQYLLHRQDPTRIKREESQQEGEGEGDRHTHLTLAIKHFQSVLDINDQLPDSRANLDLFIKLLVELLLEQNKKEEGLAILVQNCRNHPNRLNPIRYVCDFLREHHQSNIEARIHYLGNLVKYDESCSEAVELVKLSIDRDGADYYELFSILLRFLDYPHNHPSPEALTLLHKLQKIWPEYEERDEWKKRQSWWPKLYT